MATVDNLEVKIHASATQAVNAVDKLSNKLGTLSKTLQGIDSNGIAKFAQGMNQLAQGMNAIKNVKMPDFNRAAKGIKQFENINSAKLTAVANSISPLASSISVLGNMQFNNKGLTNFINSITRLSNSNINGLNINAIGQLGNAIVGLSSTLQGAQNVSTNVIQLTNAVGRLANAGNKASIVAATLPQLSVGLRSLLSAMSLAPQLSTETIQMTTALSGLANAGNKTRQTASGLNILAVELKKFMQIMATAPQVSQSVIQMTHALANLASQGSRTASASRGIQNSFRGIGSSAKSARKHISSLASVVGKLYATFWAAQRVLSGFKKAIDISSDLTEVQNVVVNTFGQYADKLEQFSKTSIKMYGMSELSAKQTASRFQAMGLAMGAPAKNMSDMSIQLTALSADLASFYNISQEESSRKLWSIFTGETEPMRAFGIDLTNATLKEYAMKKGLDANISSMTQLEKTMLRYQYVMDNTKNVQGDFARTSQTWANQLRILHEQIKAVAGVWGNAFVNMLKPLVQALNKALSAVYTFSEKVVNALGAIFGWKIEIQKGSISDDFTSAADAANDTASGTKKAADAAADLKTHLLGIDELNVVEPDTGKSSGGGGGSGSGSGTSGGGNNELKYQIKETEGLYKSSIKNLEQLGESIGNSLSKAMENIKWSKIYQKAKNFGTGLASFLNGLISPRLFGNVGKTIAGSLNTVLYAVFSFSEKFKWYNFGASLKEGINKFLETYNFETTGFTVGNLVKGLATSIYALVSDKSTWSLLGTKIGSGISGFFKSMGKTDKITGMNGWTTLAQDLSSIAEGIITALCDAIDAVSWEDVGQAIGDFISGIDWGKVTFDLLKLAAKILKAMADALAGLADTSPLATAVITVLVGLKLSSSTSLGTKLLDALGSSLSAGDLSGLQSSLNKKLAGLTITATGVGLSIANSDNPTVGNTISDTLTTTTGGALLGGLTGGIYALVASLGFKAGNALYKYVPAVQKGADTCVDAVMTHAWRTLTGTDSEAEYTKKINDKRLKAYKNRKDMNELGMNTWQYNRWKTGTYKIGWDNMSDEEKQIYINAEEQTNKKKDAAWKTLKKDAKLLYTVFTGKSADFDAQTSVNGEKTDSPSVIEKIANLFGIKWKGKDAKYDAKTAVNGKETQTNGPIFTLSNAFSAAWKGKDAQYNASTAVNGKKTATSGAIANISNIFSGAWKDKDVKFNASTAVNGKKTTSPSIVRQVSDTLKKEFTGKDVEYHIKTQKNSDLQNIGANAASQIFMGMSQKEIKFNIKNAPDPLKQAMSGTFSFMQTYATGGFPEDGWFRANQGEIMGKFDNGKSVVANNEQITAGIANGVRQAVDDALTPYLSQIARNTRETADKDTSINIDGRTLVSETDRRRSRNGYQFTTA